MRRTNHRNLVNGGILSGRIPLISLVQFNIALAKWRVKFKIQLLCFLFRRMCPTFSFFLII